MVKFAYMLPEDKASMFSQTKLSTLLANRLVLSRPSEEHSMVLICTAYLRIRHKKSSAALSKKHIC